MVAPSYSVTEVDVSEDGTFTIPERIRKRYGIVEGTMITLIKQGNCVHILPRVSDDELEQLASLEDEEEVKEMVEKLVQAYRWEVVNP